MKDIKGRAYAAVAGVKAGDRLQADGDFTCIKANAVLTVKQDDDGLYVPCKDGGHHLDGQINDGHYVGFHPVGDAR